MQMDKSIVSLTKSSPVIGHGVREIRSIHTTHVEMELFVSTMNQHTSKKNNKIKKALENTHVLI